MEILKRHLFVIILGIATAAATGFLVMRSLALKAQAADVGGKLDTILSQIQQVVKTPYALNKKNVDAMKANSDLADQQLSGLYKSLREKYTRITFTDTITPIQCKLVIDSQCEAMRQKLGLRRVALDPSMQWFDFDNWREPNIFPTAEEITLIRKHLEIVKELVDICQKTPVASVQKLTRVNHDMVGTPVPERELNYTQYEVVVTGNISQIQQFLELLNTGRYLFIISQMNINATDEFGNALALKGDAASPAPTVVPGMFPPPGGRQITPPGMPSGAMGPGGMPPGAMGPGDFGGAPPVVAPVAVPAKKLTREERIVMPRLVSLRLDLVLDFIEFNAAN
jgi:hypothetical protein